ncbi:hypothetical protein M885DRAFT_583938 [Pelagophyceae sp. CCMP2097]|nr:hypothetical protein M885DRAFT_583938 [Pelagophyceae sp. CCMP2097]
MRRRHCALLCVVVLLLLLRLVAEFRGMLRSAGDAQLLAHGLAQHRAGGCDAAVAARERAPGPRNATCALGGVLSFWAGGAGSRALAAGRSAHFERIAAASVRNHAFAAEKLGIPYFLATNGHARCGKMRAVSEHLAKIPEGAWLLFLDADAALECKSPAADVERHVCGVASMSGARFAAISLVIGSRFGFFAARNDPWARGFFRRFADTLASKPLLCAASPFPENSAANELTTEADRCHYLGAPKLVESTGFHLVGVEAKRNESLVDEYVSRVDAETRCWSGIQG